MSRLNYKPIFRHTLREYDDQPAWNVHIHDDTGHPVTVEDVGKIQFIEKTDYPVKELTICYYKKRNGVYGESYCYMLKVDSVVQLELEDIIIENDNTKKQYTLQEYEEYIKTHTLKEGGLSDVRRLTKEDVQEYKKRSVK